MLWTRAAIGCLLCCLALSGCTRQRVETDPLLGQWFRIIEPAPRQKYVCEPARFGWQHESRPE